MNHGSTILIVDDQASARQTLEGVLAGQSYNLAFAEDGFEALNKAMDLAPDLIILDVMMPKMDGFEVCERLRSKPTLAEVPILMLTALDDLDSRVRGIEAGADDFISKPFNATELRARVRTITRLNRYRRIVSERTKFEWVVKESTDGYVMIDAQQNILYANSQARLYLELPNIEHEPISETFLALVNKKYRRDPDYAWANWPEEAASVNQTPLYLVQPESPVADAFWLQVKTMRVPNLAEEAWLLNLRDVTTQMNIDRNVWEFEAMVAHKLRTPLCGVVTGLELMEESEIGAVLNEELKTVFDIVVKGARRLDRDVQNILRDMYWPTPLRLGTGFDLAFFEELITQLSADLELEAVTVSNQLSGVEVPLSRQFMELILLEILQNSQKFHPEKSPTVEIVVSAVGNDRHICIKVSDNGVNLSPEQLAQVWKPYYQADKYFTGEIPGVGLGLSRVAALLWSIDGDCRLRNREGGLGVVVELTLPQIKNVEQSTQTDASHENESSETKAHL